MVRTDTTVEHHPACDQAVCICAAQEIFQLREERDRLREQVKRWEDKEVSRATCCWQNEEAVKRLRALVKELAVAAEEDGSHSYDCISWSQGMGCNCSLQDLLARAKKELGPDPAKP